MPRWGRHFVKGAINAISNFEFVFKRLEVNVARAILNRLVQNQIDKPNDGCGVCLGFYLGSGPVITSNLQQLARFAELLEHVLHARGVGAVKIPDSLINLLDRRHHHFDVVTECEAQVFCRSGIERIGRGDTQRVFDEINRQDSM